MFEGTEMLSKLSVFSRPLNGSDGKATARDLRHQIVQKREEPGRQMIRWTGINSHRIHFVVLLHAKLGCELLFHCVEAIKPSSAISLQLSSRPLVERFSVVCSGLSFSIQQFAEE